MFPVSSQRHQWVLQLEPDLECCLRGSLYRQHTHEMPSFCTLRKVRGLRKFIITTIYLILLTCPAFAFPTNSTAAKPPNVLVMHNGDRLILRTEGCQPVPPEVLRARLGPYFDDTKMRMDDDSDNDKRSSSHHAVIDNDDVDNDEDLISSYLNDQSNINDISDSDRGVDTISVQRKYMRRKRDVLDFDDSDTDSPLGSSFLYQNLIYDTIAKRKSRQKRKSNSKSQFHPAWECEKKTKWRKMAKGYFPQQVLDAECTQKKCFFGQYRCVRKQYAIKILKRDPKELCNPLPLVGSNTTYEESWKVKSVTVTVACECGLPSNSDRNSNRKRKRGRGRNE